MAEPGWSDLLYAIRLARYVSGGCDMKMIRRACWVVLTSMMGCALMGQEAGNSTVVPPETNNAAIRKKAAARPTESSRPFALTTEEPLSARAPGDFAIAVLPDTQMYTAARNGGQPEMLVAQVEWILSNCGSRNIVYVTTEGDISNDGNKYPVQWQRVTNAFYRLEDPVRTGRPEGLPWSAVVGNHDTHSGGTLLFNTYLGTNHFAGRSYYGGIMAPTMTVITT
jgi:hypothetical protein